jgi:uncharacterized protein YjiS (DUF1127 family)
MRTMPWNVTLFGSESPRRLARGLVLGYLALEERRQQRRALLALDERLLKDIGLTRADVEQECGKPLWR